VTIASCSRERRAAFVLRHERDRRLGADTDDRRVASCARRGLAWAISRALSRNQRVLRTDRQIPHTSRPARRLGEFFLAGGEAAHGRWPGPKRGACRSCAGAFLAPVGHVPSNPAGQVRTGTEHRLARYKQTDSRAADGAAGGGPSNLGVLDPVSEAVETGHGSAGSGNHRSRGSDGDRSQRREGGRAPERIANEPCRGRSRRRDGPVAASRIFGARPGSRPIGGG
jgi:hypothetical protein